MTTLLLCLIVCFGSISGEANKQDEEVSAVQWLTDYYDPGWAKRDYEQTMAAWDHTTNMDDAEANAKNQAESSKMDEFAANASLTSKTFLTNIKKFADPSVERQLKMIVDEGFTNDPEQTTVVANILDLWKKDKICAFESGKQNCSTKWGWQEYGPLMLARSDYDMVKYIVEQLWIKGAKVKPFLEQIVKLDNKKATENGYKDYGDYKRSIYEDPNLPASLERMWTEMLPLYEQIHTYYRRTLRSKFPGKMDKKNTIPSYFPSTSDQEWSTDPKLIYPFPKEAELNVTKLLLDSSCTGEKMYRKVDDFVDSMGLKRMEKPFWKNSLFAQPDGKKFADCKPQAWKFGDDKDLKTMTCTVLPSQDWLDANGIFAFAEFLTYADVQRHNVFRHTSRFPLLDAFGKLIVNNNLVQILDARAYVFKKLIAEEAERMMTSDVVVLQPYPTH